MNLVAISGTDGTGRDRAYMVRSLLQSLLSALLRSRLSALLSALKIAPKPCENGPYNCSQTALKSIREPLGELLELSGQPGGLLEDSRNALEALLDASETQKSNWGTALGRPEAPRRLVSACLGAKYPPKMSPGGSQNRGPKAVQAQNGKTLIFNDLCKDFNDF